MSYYVGQHGNALEPIYAVNFHSNQYQAIEAAQKWHYEMCDKYGYEPEQLVLTKESVQGHCLQPVLVLEPMCEGKRDPYVTYHIHQMGITA